MKRILRRVIAAVSVVAIVSSFMVTPSFALTSLGTESAEKSVRTDTTTLMKMEQESYYETLIGNLNVAIKKCREELDKDNKDTGAILLSYANVLILADGVTRAFYVEESEEANLASATAYCLWNIPGNIQAERSNAEAVNILNEINDLHMAVSSCDAFCSEYNWGEGKFKELVVGFGYNLTQNGDSISTGSGSNLIDSGCWDVIINSIIAYYIEGKIGSILIQSEDKCASLRTNTSTPGNQIIDSVTEALEIDPKDKDAVKTLYASHKDALMPYLSMYNEIRLGLETQRSIGLENFEHDGKRYIAYHVMQIDDSRNPATYISDLTYTMWELAFSASSDTPPTDTNDLIESVDVRSDAMALMSNCTINNGTILMPTDGSEPGLKQIGYVILAAGCTYDPFVSHSCDDAYMSVVRAFLKSDEQYDDILKVLQVAANTKKPLYVTEGSNSDWKKATDLESISMADYHWATLKDVLEIDKNKTKAYALMKGQMTPSQVDASTWEYTNYGTQNGNSAGSTTGVTVTNPNATDQTVSANTTQGTVSPGLVTVGSQQVQASATQMTKPVMMTAGREENFFTTDATGFPAVVGGMTSVIINNAAVDAKGHAAIQRADREMLFMNGLGDIVLSDNTIILPAVANPLMYGYGDDYTGKNPEEFMDLFVDPTADYKAYYPYTAAFMNHYPTASVGVDKKLEVSNANDLNKFLICVDSNTLYAKRLTKIGESAKLTATGGVTVCTIHGSSFNVTQNQDEGLSVLVIAEGKGGFNWHNVNLGAFFAGVGGGAVIGFKAGAAGGAAGGTLAGPAGTAAGGATGAIVGGVSGGVLGAAVSVSKWNQTLFITRGGAMTGSGLSFFPLNTSSADIADDYLEVAAPLTTSALRFISTTEEVSGVRESSGRFRVDHYIIECCGEAMLGNQYSETFDKNYQVSYEDLVNDSGGRFLKFVSQICESALEYLGRIDGVLAVKGPYSNKFFNIVVRFIQQFYLLIAAALMIIVAAKFLKGHYNMIYVVFLGVLCICGFEVYANWMPTMVPSIYNFAVNDAIEDIVWSTVAHQAEQYGETYKDSDRKDPSTGYIKPYTATITLYTLSNAEMESIVERVAITDEMLRSGTQVFLDNDAGIFVQGNQIKMSVDKLLTNNSIRGLYQSQWNTLGADTTNSAFIPPINEVTNDNPYSVQLQSSYVSLESYYTPFDHFERAFMINLNTFANIFRIERNQFSYDNGKIYKDAFLVQAFIHSGIFTSPGNDEVLAENIAANSVLGGNSYTADDIINMCNTYFALKDETLRWDWLNLRSIFVDPPESVRTSLWGQIMQTRGWYDAGWQITPKGEQQVSELITYINNQTKLWIIRNEQQLNYLSDENAIKLISLYATTAFTHFTSEFGSWLYPNYINASDIELQDVLYGSMTTLRDRSHAYDGNVVNTVALNNGIFGIIFLLLIIVFATIFVFVVTYLVPILYALFGGILVFKLINDTEGIGLVKGYIKVTGVTAVLYFIFSLSLKLVRVGGYNWYGYLGCALVILLCVYFLFWVVLSVVQDIGELGNNTLQRNLLHGLDKITRGAVQRLTVNTTNMYQNTRNGFNRAFGARRYGRSYNIDDYDGPVGHRGGYGSYSGYDSYGGYDRYEGRRRSAFGGFGRGDYFNDDYSAPRRRRFGLFGGQGGHNTESPDSVDRRGWSRQTRDTSNTGAGGNRDDFQ